jgi:glucose-6-phosphate 1-epimerase
VYRVEIQPERLTTTLFVTNTGRVSFPFQVLYHTYYRVPHHSKATTVVPNDSVVTVDGLDGYHCVNQDNQDEFTQEGRFTLPDQHTDMIFSPSSQSSSHVNNHNRDSLELQVGVGNTIHLNITAKGHVDGQSVPVSVCVWNPHLDESKSLNDFPDDGYHDMIGVEPGLLRDDVPWLSMGQTMSFSVSTSSSS